MKSVSNDTIFTVIVTICIFVIGIILNRLLRVYDRLKKNWQIREHFIYFYNRTNKNLLPPLISCYKEFYTTTDINSGFSKTSPKLMSGDFKRISEYDTSILLGAFNYKKDVTRILSHADFIEKLTAEADFFYYSVLKDSDVFRDKLTRLLEEYFHLLSEYVDYERNNTPAFEQDAIWILINSSIVKYYNDFAGKRLLSKFYREILRPIQKELVISNYFRTKPKAKEIAFLGKEISHRYMDLKRLTVEVKIQYRHFAFLLTDIRKELISYNLKNYFLWSGNCSKKSIN